MIKGHGPLGGDISRGRGGDVKWSVECVERYTHSGLLAHSVVCSSGGRIRNKHAQVSGG